MDDLLRDFLTESAESLTVVDGELVKLESDPNNKEVLQKIFRLVHTIKGTAVSSVCRGLRRSRTTPRTCWENSATAKCW